MQNSAKGMIKSDNPDLLVNIFTKERERIDESIQCWLGLWMGIRMEPLLWEVAATSAQQQKERYILT
jgi:hypothetical protein